MMVVSLPAVCRSRPIYPVLRARCAMANVEKVTIALAPEMAGFVHHAVETGQYASTSEAIRETVREWQERRDLLGYTVDELRVLVQEGIDSGPATPSIRRASTTRGDGCSRPDRSRPPDATDHAASGTSPPVDTLCLTDRHLPPLETPPYPRPGHSSHSGALFPGRAPIP
ncbi:type II toxin-antitoxin system ParD family antitoxin [Tistrella mobilis]|uniref:type II toxin-antitoxin system ParD family antitoxin n=1 Tax=Tistrella mobilis TaxID=171437 RepID=UPI003558FC0E